MAWNEPGNDNNSDKDPWGRPKKTQGPPELDKVLKNLQKKLDSLFKGNNKGSDGDGGNQPPSENNIPFLSIGLIAIAVLVIWVISGIYIVRPAEEAAVLRFGKYIETTQEGPHWAPRFIDSVYKVNIQKIYSYTYTSDMLTKDENIVTVTVSVQYRVGNANNYLFNVVNPIVSLKEATASALRQVIGNTTLDEVLTSGREKVRQDVQVQLRKILNLYKAGIDVTEVALQPAKAPEQVKEAFDDAIKAEQDRERFINQARAYLEKRIATSVGKEKRLLADAGAYKAQVVLNANGETARYLALLPQYQEAPEVTRERIYLGAMQLVLSKSSKIFIDEQRGSNLLLGVPLQQLLQNVGQRHSAAAVTPPLADNNSDSGQASASDNKVSSGQPSSKDFYSLNSQRFPERTGRGS